MPHKYFEQTRIRQLTLPTSFDTNKIQIGIPVDADEASMVGLHNIGESVLPSPDFGCVSKRNVCGYEYADKSQPKRRRKVEQNLSKVKKADCKTAIGLFYTGGMKCFFIFEF